MVESPTSWTAAGITRRIRDGEVSTMMVVDAFLERIHARNDRTNAFITVTDDLAREMARDADDALESGTPLGPLHGVPVAIKDLYDVKGVPTTSGSLLVEDRNAEEDSLAVERLRGAGAVVLGKTNTPEFGMGPTSDNRVAGPTGTPFDPDRVAGGSSGGAGAAVADSLVPLAHGSDGGGSIRTPASFCGVYGLKPSYGVIPNPSRPNAFASHTPFSSEGPLTRTVEDAAIMLDAMAGRHPRDPLSVPLEVDYRDATDEPIDELSIAYSHDLGAFPVSSTVRDIIDDAVSAFETAGATVESVEPDLGHSQQEILEANKVFMDALFQMIMEGFERKGYDPRGADQELLGPDLIFLIEESEPPSVREYKKADVVRTHVYDGVQDIFEQHDLLVSATLSLPAFPHGEYPSSVDGVEVEGRGGWSLTLPYNFSGHPAASIPAGFIDGLPVGLQIAGRRFADDDVLAASAAFERIRPWSDAYPD